jgi:hypothetical protein
VFFYEQTAEALNEALNLYERKAGDFNPAAARENAMRFDRARFKKEFRDYVNALTADTEASKEESACSKNTAN